MRAWLFGVMVLSACQCVSLVDDDAGVDAGRPRRDAGVFVFDAGPPKPFVPINACDWDWREFRWDGGVEAWALGGAGCASFQFSDAGIQGTFATLEECEAACPCDATKFSGNFPSCDWVNGQMEDGGSFSFIDSEVPGYGIGPGDMADLCRLSIDGGLGRAECFLGE